MMFKRYCWLGYSGDLNENTIWPNALCLKRLNTYLILALCLKYIENQCIKILMREF